MVGTMGKDLIGILMHIFRLIRIIVVLPYGRLE